VNKQSATCYPWLTGYWNKLVRYQQQDKLPGAMMLLGDEGLGLSSLAECFAQSVFCLDVDAEGFACGRCSSCLLFQSGAYPDYFKLQPEKDKTTISIGAVRHLSEKLSLSTQYTKPRIAIIDSADAMLYQASNSLLKTLEEPSGNTTLILIAHQLAKIPMTIRSRCQIINVKDIDRQKAQAWLENSGCEEAKQYLHLANYSPLLARTFANSDVLKTRDTVLDSFLAVLQRKVDPLAFANMCFKHKELPVIDWLMSILTDVIKCGYDLNNAIILSEGSPGHLKVLAEKLHLKEVHRLLDKLLRLKRLQSSQVNKQLMLEEFAIYSYSLTVK